MTCIWGVTVERWGKIRCACSSRSPAVLVPRRADFSIGSSPSVGLDKFAFAGSDLHLVLWRVHVTPCDGIGGRLNPASPAGGPFPCNFTPPRCRSTQIYQFPDASFGNFVFY